MKIKLNTGRTVQRDSGRFASQLPGDVVEVSADEAERLISKGQAVAVSEPKKKVAKKQAAKKIAG